MTMVYNSTLGAYMAVIPGYPGGVSVYFKVYASDTSGQWSVSSLYTVSFLASVSSSSSGGSFASSGGASSSGGSDLVVVGFSAGLAFVVGLAVALFVSRRRF